MMIRIEPSGVVMLGVCTIQTPLCTAIDPAPITAVWTYPGRTQINVCRTCLEEMIRDGQWLVQGAKVPIRYDIAVYDKAGQLALAVEVKSNPPQKKAQALAWAVNIHRNLIVHSALPVAPFFLLVGYPSHFYLWNSYAISEPDKESDIAIQDEKLLKPYLQNGKQDNQPGVEHHLTQAVSSWLQTLVAEDKLQQQNPPDWIKASGLLDAIQAGSVVLESSASQQPRVPIIASLRK